MVVIFARDEGKNIKGFVVACEICERNKYDNLSPARLLQLLSVPTQI